MIENENDWSKKRYGFLFVTALLFLYGTYVWFSVSDIGPADLQIIDSLVINEKPALKESRGKSSRKWIEFKSEGFWKYFEIGHFDYECANNEKILNELQVGDTISVKLLKSELNEINEETFSSKSNTIHSLVFKNFEYLDLACRNEKARDDNKFACYLCFIIAPLTLFMGLFKSEPKLFGVYFEPALAIGIIGILVLLILKYFSR